MSTTVFYLRFVSFFSFHFFNISLIYYCTATDPDSMATSSSFAQIWSGVQVEYDEGKLTADAPHSPPTTIVRRPSKPKTYPQQAGYKWQIVWRNVIGFIVLHSITITGFYMMFFGLIQIKTILFSKYTHDNIIHPHRVQRSIIILLQ